MLDSMLLVMGAQYVLLNPFLMAVYLTEIIKEHPPARFAQILLRAGAISSVVFVLFALSGDAIFRKILNVRFASFVLFGGVMWLVIALRFALQGSVTIAALRGAPQHVAGAIAMPFMIGPGTVSGSILAGARLNPATGALAMVLAVVATLGTVFALKVLHDRVAQRHEALIERYTDLVGRISALVVGTFAVDMILQGIELWRQ